MHASGTMTRDVMCAPPELGLGSAWQAMQARNVRHLPVLSGGRLVGILSDRDILRYSEQTPDGLAVPDMHIGEVMKPVPLTCRPHTSISWIADQMVSWKIDAMPVVDDGYVLLGLVTSTDLLELLIDHDEAKIIPFDWKLYDASGVEQAA